MSLDRDTVLATLKPDDVLAHLGIKGVWRGRWLRSTRCPTDDHGTDAFGVSRDGKWHCFACDKGGDLISLLALGEGLKPRDDFRRVLEIAAQLAGVEDSDDFAA